MNERELCEKRKYFLFLFNITEYLRLKKERKINKYKILTHTRAHTRVHVCIRLIIYASHDHFYRKKKKRERERINTV